MPHCCVPAPRTMLFRAVLYVVLISAVALATYPMTTLRCYSTYTKPDGQLICPEARSKFCVKEVSTLRQDLCGHTQYFGDTYVLNTCVLRKCAAECVNENIAFTYGGVPYSRVRTCCSTDYCNAAPRSAAAGSSLLSIVCIAVLSLLLSWR